MARKKRTDGKPGAPAPEPPARGRGRRWLLLALLALFVLGAAAAWWAHRPSRPNLLLVTIDTLRADRVGAYGHALADTPEMDGLARRGVRFDHAHTTSPLTGPSHATILTGQYPPVHGVRENVNFLIDERQPTLAARLKAAGYRTAAFIGAYPVAAAFGFARGFDRFDEDLHPNPGIGQGAERPGNEVADAAVGWLSRREKGPFFAWVHFYDPHTPYTPPPPFAQRFAGRPYDGEVAFADAQLGRLLTALRGAGHEKDTLVVVLSDHGEGLGDHGEATHGLLLYESTLRVPLIMAGPGVPAAKVVGERAGTIDVPPTVLGLLGLPADPRLPGRDLRRSFEGRRLPPDPLYSEALFGRLNCRWAALRGWTHGEWKLVEGGETELFHLPTDPAERRNRAGDEPDRLARMQEALRHAVDAMAPRGDRPRPFTLAPEQEERLRSLGYVAGTGGAGPIDEPGLPDPRPRVETLELYQSLQSATGPGIGPAIREVGAALERDRDNPFGYFVLASLAYRGGRLGLAAKAFVRTLELDPERPVIRQYYGSLLRDMGRLEESEQELRIAVAQAAADDYITQSNLAQTLVLRGKLDEAEKILSEILEKEPKHSKARGALGGVLLARGRVEDAVPNLERAAEQGEAEPLLELAEAYLALQRITAARDAAQRALERNPGHPWALSVLAQVLLAEGRREEAVAMLQRAVRVGPRRPAVWSSLARAFESAGDRAMAERCRRNAKAPYLPAVE